MTLMSSESNVSSEQHEVPVQPPVVAGPDASNLPAPETEEVKFTARRHCGRR